MQGMASSATSDHKGAYTGISPPQSMDFDSGTAQFGGPLQQTTGSRFYPHPPFTKTAAVAAIGFAAELGVGEEDKDNLAPMDDPWWQTMLGKEIWEDIMQWRITNVDVDYDSEVYVEDD
ncbi:uncharacterized protein ARMOST_22149 [Armillaria ostoyae]|uniref:Uncharacterized protein n=1 Tax=Armillaria ostoyae TaxID=47428 RepID=A0A284SC26_ARMOS|nr:uncharacterized protein ARMOST_22149 [Armillaria ostoyae]